MLISDLSVEFVRAHLLWVQKHLSKPCRDLPHLEPSIVRKEPVAAKRDHSRRLRELLAVDLEWLLKLEIAPTGILQGGGYG